MKNILIVLLVLLLNLGSLYAQQIKVTVNGSGNPIVGATVRLLELDRSSHTDARGQVVFANVPKGIYRIFVRVIGYASTTNTVRVDGPSAETTLTVHESAIGIEEVVVSASPYPRTADDQYQSAESKSMAELHDSPGSSFAEEISDLPGVTVRGNGSAPSRPILRGLSDNRVLSLENGLRTGDISTYDPAHAVPIDALSISQIDVVRGPASILYGPSTIGGLVNVITNTIPTFSTNPFSGRVSLAGNSVSDEYAGYFDGVYSNGGHALGISAGGVHSQDIRIPTGEYADPASGQEFNLNRMPQSFDHTQEGSIGYSYQNDFGMIGIGGKHYEMNYGIPGVPPNPNWMNVPPATSRITQYKNSLELRSLFVVDGSLIKQGKFNANYVDYRHSEYPTAEDSTGVSDPQANEFHKQAFNATLQFEHRQFGKFQGVAGLWTNIENLTIEGDMPLGPNSITTGIAGYAYEEYLADENTRLQVGVRYDFNRIQTKPYTASTDSVFQVLDVARESNAVTASIGAIEKVTQDLTASLSIARSFRPPTVQELFANGLDAASATYSIGDASLNPETGIGVDASLKGSFSNFSFELSPYVNFINNYIYAFLTGDTLQAFPVRQFSATDARLEGFEALVMVQPMQKIAVRASVDFVNAEDTKNNVPLPFTPPMRGLLRMSYQDEMYSGMVEWRLVARQTRLGDGDTPTAGYGVINLGAGIRFAREGMEHTMSIHCDNLFNLIYRDNLSVIKDFLPQPARGVRLNYDLVF
jgi:iron complex outermembrane receptor protein